MPTQEGAYAVIFIGALLLGSSLFMRAEVQRGARGLARWLGFLVIVVGLVLLFVAR